MCRNKQIQEVEGIASSTNYFIGFVGAEMPPGTASIEILGKCEKMVQFKMTLEPDVNIINQETWIHLGKLTLKGGTYSQLLSPAGRIPTLGKFSINIGNNEMFIFVIDSNSCNLLSRSTATNMGLVKLVNSVNTFSKVKCDPVNIKLKPNTKLLLHQWQDVCLNLSWKRLRKNYKE